MEVEDEGTNGGDEDEEEEGDGESSSSSSTASSSSSSSSSASASAAAADPAAPSAAAPTKKRGRTGPLLIMGLPECPIPKDEEIQDVSDDEVAPSDDVSVCCVFAFGLSLPSTMTYIYLYTCHRSNLTYIYETFFFMDTFFFPSITFFFFF